MTKRLKTLIYSSVGIVATTAIITPIALTYTNKENNSSINKIIPKILSQQNINNSNLSNLSSNWINNNKSTNFVENLYNSIIDPNSNTILNTNFLKVNYSTKNSNNNELSNLKKLSISNQNKVKNAMLNYYISIKNELNKKNIDSSDYISQFSKYLNKSSINDIEEGISNILNDKNKTNHSAFLFIKGNISFTSSVTLEQIVSNLNIASADLNYLAIAAGAITVAAGIGSWFFPPLAIVATTAGIIASVAGITSSILYIAYDAIASQVNQLPNGWLTGYNTLSATITLGHTFSSILEATTNALDCFGKWAIAIPIFGQVVNILNAIINDLYS